MTTSPPGRDDADPGLARARTSLAWTRTALAFAAVGAVVAVAAYGEWVRSQRALRLGQPLPRSVMPLLLAAVITVIAVLAAIVVLVSALR